MQRRAGHRRDRRTGRPARIGIPSAENSVAADGALLNVEAGGPPDRRPGPRAADHSRVPRVIHAGGGKTGDCARGGHARNGADGAGHLLVERDASRSIVADGRKVHLESQDPIDAESQIDVLDTVEAGHQHPGANQERQRQRQLRRRQTVANPVLTPGAGGGTRLLAERLDRRRPRQAQRRRHATADCGGHGDERRKSQNDRDRIRSRRAAAARPGRAGAAARPRCRPASVPARRRVRPAPRSPSAAGGRAGLGPSPARSESRTPGHGRSRGPERGWRR